MTHPISLTLYAVVLFSIGVIAQTLHMPACMSSCTLPFSANHEPDLCTSSWIDRISACIEDSCSTTSPVAANGTNITLTLVPKLEYACIQSHVPGNDNSPVAPILRVNDGECAESPFRFLSFLPSYTDPTTIQKCRLVLFSQRGCSGIETTMAVTHDVMSGICSFNSGQSVRLDCAEAGPESAGETISCVQRTEAIGAGTGSGQNNTTFPPLAINNITSISNSSTSQPFVNKTTQITTSSPTTGVITAESDISKAEKAAQHGGVTQWALIVVVFVRSVLL